MKEGAGGSPISYAKASQGKAAVPPVRQSTSVQHSKTGMQGLGKIPGGKTDVKAERHHKGHMDSPVAVREKKVTILRRNQDLSDVQDVAKQDVRGWSDVSNQTAWTEGQFVKPEVKRKEEESPQPKHTGSPSAQLPRLTKGREKEDVDELSTIWQKLMQVQDSPARSKDEDEKRTRKTTSTTEEDEEGQDDSEEYVTSMGSQDDDDDAERRGVEEMERMTPDTQYRKVR